MTAGPPGQVVIGLDVGTTGVKAAAFGVGSPWRAVAIREYPLLEAEAGQAVQDPVVILTAARAALAECGAAVGSAELLAIAVSTGMHGLMALDGDHRPLTPLITWADARASAEARSLRASGQAAELHALTGVPVHPMTPLTKLMWFEHHDRATKAAARWWVGLKEWVLLWLTGRLVTELSSASGSGLLELATRAWSPAALEVAGISVDRLPQILAPTATLALCAETARQVGLPVGTTVVAGAGDGPLGNVGTGALARGVAGLNIGTSGAVRMAVDEPQVDDGRTLFCYAVTESTWVVGAAISNGGGVLRWAGRELVPDVTAAAADDGADAAVLALAARVPPGSEGLVMLPYLVAERAPLWDADLPGAYLGLRREHGRAHMIRAAVEGVALQMRLILDRLDEVDPVASVRATGGVFRSALWQQVMAAMLARPIELVGDAAGTALGAAALGLFALGRAPSLTAAVEQLADPTAAAPAIEPDAELVAAYDRLRAAVPELIAGLDVVGGLFATSETARQA